MKKLQEKTNAPNNSITREKFVIAFTSVIEALFLLLELYFMIHSEGNFTILIAIAICMVVVLFFLVLAIIELNQKTKERDLREYEEINKAQKASYIAARKYFDEIGERLSVLEQNTSFPAEDIITAQKAVAKITINRNKENAEALMNANDELIQKIFGFEEKLTDNNAEFMKNIQSQFDVIHTSLEKMQQELNEMEMTRATAVPYEMPVMQNMADVPTAEETPIAEELPIIEELPEAEELPTMEELPETEELPIMEELPETEELPTMEELPEAEELPTMEELPEAEELPTMEELPETEDLPTMEELPETEELPTMEELPIMEEAPITEEEPPAMDESLIEEEKPPMPDLSDPNRQLSPEEIAALFANM